MKSMQKQFCFICIKRQIWVWDDRRYNCLEIQNKNSRGEVKSVTGGQYLGDRPNWIPPKVIQVPYTTLLIRLIFDISTLMLGRIVWTCSIRVTDLSYPQRMLSLCQHKRWIENELSEESKFMSKTSSVKKKLHVLSLFKIVLGNPKFALAK